MIPYGRQDISKSDIDAVAEVLRSNWLTQGPMVPKFEEAIAEHVGAQRAVAVNSATSALHIACLALGVGSGDWVWTSPNTFVASANCALFCGAKVDFVDIDSRTYNMSVERLAEKLEQAKAINRLPKVVIPVHFAGQPCDLLGIQKLSRQYGFKVIEDASHAIGAYYCITSEPGQLNHQIKVGSCAHSDITILSFHPVKIITTGEGGMALTNDTRLAEKMSRLRTHGITNKSELMESRPVEEIWNYQQIELGFNYRMTDIQAALGLCQLERLGDFINRRCEIASVYDHAFKDLPINTPYQEVGIRSSYHLYPIRLNSFDRPKISQREVYKAFRAEGIEVNLHYIPVHRQPYYEAMGFKVGDFPEAELFHKETISLPIFPTLSPGQQHHVISTARRIFT